MKVIKYLSDEELADISNFLSNEINKEISYITTPKEIVGMDVNVNITFDDDERKLDVDTEVDLDTDESSEVSKADVSDAVDRAYSKLDNYINAHYKVEE